VFVQEARPTGQNSTWRRGEIYLLLVFYDRFVKDNRSHGPSRDTFTSELL